MKQEIIISTKELAIGYSNKRKKTILIDNISIEIPKGQLTAVIGLNGIGKSTFIRTLAKQQPKLNGSFTLQNKDSNKYSNKEWAKQVAWVQTDQVNSLNLAVEEFISLGRQPYTNWLDRISEKDKKIINTVIETSELSELRNRKCNQLSDGQLQRVYIARALAQDTPLIILDEPTTHLDIIHKANTLDLLSNLCKKFDKTIIYTTHEIELSLQFADYFIGIQKNLITLDTTQNMIKNETLNAIFNYKKIIFNTKDKKFNFIKS